MAGNVLRLGDVGEIEFLQPNLVLKCNRINNELLVINLAAVTG
jgi:hypothetical protein